MNANVLRLSEQGSVLIITLLLMLMLTIMAVAQVSYNSTQTHITSNTADEQIAFQTAEGALNEATNNLLAGNFQASGFLANTKGLYLFNPNNAPVWTSVNWTDTNAVIMSFQGNSNAQAAYLIEQLPAVVRPGQNAHFTAQVYRVTAHAIGATTNSSVILQNTIQLQQ